MRYQLTLILSLFLSNAFGQIPNNYFLYEKKPIELDERSFSRYLMPQFRAINQEFFHILRKLNPLNDELISIYQNVAEAQNDYNNFQKECSQIEEGCLNKLAKIYKQMNRLDISLLKFREQLSDFNQQENDADLENSILLFSISDEISLHTHTILHFLEEYKITANTNYFPYFSQKNAIKPLLDSMTLSSELMLTQMLGGQLKDDFYSVWLNFMKEVNQKIIRNQDKDFLLRRLEDLNLSWNTFHMKMTKGNYDLPKSITSIIKIMHNRWNSCLKVILR